MAKKHVPHFKLILNVAHLHMSTRLDIAATLRAIADMITNPDMVACGNSRNAMAFLDGCNAGVVRVSSSPTSEEIGSWSCVPPWADDEVQELLLTAAERRSDARLRRRGH